MRTIFAITGVLVMGHYSLKTRKTAAPAPRLSQNLEVNPEQQNRLTLEVNKAKKAVS